MTDFLLGKYRSWDVFSNAEGIPPQKPTEYRAKKHLIFGLIFTILQRLIYSSKNTWFSLKISLVSLNLKSKPKHQTQLASKHRFSKPILKIKQVLIGYHHIIFPSPFHFTSLSNLKTSKKSANLVRTSFFLALKIHPNSVYFFWNAKWPIFLKKKHAFQGKTPK